MAVRFGVSSTVKNRLPRYSNFWDGTAVYSPFSPTGSYDALATYTVPSGGVSSITFAGIPNTYSHLQIRSIAQCSSTGSDWQRLLVSFNSDTTNSNYVDHLLYGTGSSAAALAETSTRKGFGTASRSGVSYFAVGVTDVLDYASSSKYKTSRTLTGLDTNGNGQIRFESNLWMSTSPISSITLTIEDSSNFNQYSQFSLYGIR